MSLTPEYVKQFLHKDEYNLYALIYSRALASLMAARIEDVTTLKLDGNGYIFKAEATQQKFDMVNSNHQQKQVNYLHIKLVIQ